jgi:hypothetical protein
MSQSPSWAVAAMIQLWEGRRTATTWAEEDIVVIRYQATSGEDIAHREDSVRWSEKSIAWFSESVIITRSYYLFVQ